MASLSFNEQSLSFPARFVKDCPGLAFDIGGSVCKFVYRNKADWEEFQNSKGDKLRCNLRLVSFSRPDFDKGVDYLKQNAYISQNEDGTPMKICGCGLGTGPFATALEERLNVKPATIMEFDGFVAAHHYLYQFVPWKEIEIPIEISDPDKQSMAEDINGFIANHKPDPSNQDVYPESAKTVRRRIFRSLAMDIPGEEDRPRTPPPQRLPGELPEMEDSLSKYPCFLVSMGSIFASLKVKPPGQKYQLVHALMRGGKTFTSLGSLMLGIKNFDELMDLAEKGNYRIVSRMTSDLMTNASFANAIGKSLEDFSREDIASALLFHTVQDFVHQLVILCTSHNLRNVMLCGSFVNRPCVRSMIYAEWYRQLVQKAYLTDNTADVSLFILKQGAFLGAIGCMINTVEPFREI